MSCILVVLVCSFDGILVACSYVIQFPLQVSLVGLFILSKV